MATIVEVNMEWIELSRIKKFTSIKDVFEKVGLPKFKLGNRPVYYMGKGFLISFSSRKFKAENNNRVEYGEEGEYALSVYFFKNKKDLKAHFKIKNEQFSFEENDILGNENFEIFEGIELNSTLDQVANYLIPKSTGAYYHKGETRAFNNGIFTFQNNFVAWDNYIFFFFDKSTNTKVSGFECTLVE